MLQLPVQLSAAAQHREMQGVSAGAGAAASAAGAVAGNEGRKGKKRHSLMAAAVCVDMLTQQTPR